MLVLKFFRSIGTVVYERDPFFAREGVHPQDICIAHAGCPDHLLLCHNRASRVISMVAPTARNSDILNEKYKSDQ